MEGTDPLAHSELIESSVAVVEGVVEGEVVPGGIDEVVVGSTSPDQDGVQSAQEPTKGSAVRVEVAIVKDVPWGIQNNLAKGNGRMPRNEIEEGGNRLPGMSFDAPDTFHVGDDLLLNMIRVVFRGGYVDVLGASVDTRVEGPVVMGVGNDASARMVAVKHTKRMTNGDGPQTKTPM